MKHLFKINDFAKIHKTTRDTLLWYDKINLFKPYIVKDNGYRYYSLDQSHLLQTILICRQLDFTIEEIRKLVENRFPETLEIINSKLTEINNSILKLRTQYSHLQTMLYLANSSKNTNNVEIVELPEIIGTMSPYGHTISDRPLTPDFPDKIESIPYSQNAIRGRRISIKHLLQQSTCHHWDIFYIYPFQGSVPTQSTIIFPKGKYIQTIYSGPPNGLFSCYQQLVDYALMNTLSLSEYAYELHIRPFAYPNFSNDSSITLLRFHVVT